MHNEIAAPDVQTVVSSIWYVITLLGTIAATVYYIRANWGDIHHAHAGMARTHHAKSQLRPISADYIKQQPWANGYWYCDGPSRIQLKVLLVNDESQIILTGLGEGGHMLELVLVDQSASTFFGELRCVEHGGVVASEATLRLVANNRLRRQLYPDSELMPIVDVYLSHSHSASE